MRRRVLAFPRARDKIANPCNTPTRRATRQDVTQSDLEPQIDLQMRIRGPPDGTVSHNSPIP
jgi:hypothetical protein